MSIAIKPKQAFGFLPARNCICNSPYCQPIVTTDSFMIQGTVSEIPGNRVLSGGFDSSTGWTLGAGWTISGGKLRATNISGTNAFSGPLQLSVGKLYLVQIEITVTSVGSAGADEGWLALINNDFLKLPNTTLGFGYNQSLTASWIYSPAAINTNDFIFSANENTIDFEVEYVKVLELSQPGLAIMQNGIVVEEIVSFSGSNFLKYYFNGTLFMNNGSLIGGITNILYESVTDVTAMWELYIDTWESVTDETGCLTVRFYDTVFWTNRIRNPNFTTDLSFWTAGSGWTQSAGQACYSSGGAIAALTQTTILMGGIEYRFQIGSSSETGLESLVFSYSINGGPAITPSSPDNEWTIDLTGETGLVTVVVSIRVGTSTDTICIDDILLIAQGYDDVNETNCINIQTEHPCTILLYAINWDNAFGLNYTTGDLQQWLRVYGKIKYSDYPEEVEVFKFSDNSNQIMFASSEKEFEVIIGDAPEQIHDCISILRLHDIFQIDGYSFVRSGNYDLNRRRSSDNSQAIFTVKEQQGVSSNYSCL